MMNKLKGHIYDLVLFLATFGPRKKASVKKILIIRVDEIGDYILWRPFLKEMLSSAHCAGAEIHFLGNQSWRSLFSLLDISSANKVSWMDKIRFKSNIPYRFGLLKQVYKEGYETVINPTFSRDKRYDDSIVKATRARHRIGMVSNKESIKPYETGYDKGLYTLLFDHPEKPVFEFYRNQFFTNFVTGKISEVTNTKIDTTLLPALPFTLPANYFIVFPGSRSASRIWPTENFIKTANFLFDQFGWTAVVCGTNADKVYTDRFIAQYSYSLIDLTGKTSLPDMLSVFAKAKCLLSVDTGSVHLATAVGCTVFGIFNGSQYGRFAPYPASVASGVHAVYPDDVEEEVRNKTLVMQKYEFVVSIPYSDIAADKLIHEIRTTYQV